MSNDQQKIKRLCIRDKKRIGEGFRLFNKVSYQAEEGFVFGRRSSGYFDIRTLEGVRITASANSKRLRLIEPKRTFLIQLKGSAIPPASEDAGFLADFL